MNYPSPQSKFLIVFYMSESFLPTPENWQKIALEADREADFIVKVESGGTPDPLCSPSIARQSQAACH